MFKLNIIFSFAILFLVGCTKPGGIMTPQGSVTLANESSSDIVEFMELATLNAAYGWPRITSIALLRQHSNNVASGIVHIENRGFYPDKIYHLEDSIKSFCELRGWTVVENPSNKWTSCYNGDDLRVIWNIRNTGKILNSRKEAAYDLYASTTEAQGPLILYAYNKLGYRSVEISQRYRGVSDELTHNFINRMRSYVSIPGQKVFRKVGDFYYVGTTKSSEAGFITINVTDARFDTVITENSWSGIADMRPAGFKGPFESQFFVDNKNLNLSEEWLPYPQFQEEYSKYFLMIKEFE